ncbi:DUF4437 domain-containing protein [Luteimonas composti]|uniref:DUF4437 domain-containing protein n=1 Tax=Luteimonas composti TaxID=398257 RepID=A0ABT6MP48_9GAMM|nr:DUF4437 domain-containing protein [Luteimonas composti]MDH7452223.1 DUF4437 domain-containing protein [Luteimonas composti]
MRPAVPFLDTHAMEWVPGDMPGLFTKMLSADPETGARSALQCIDPARGYKAPALPHYHDGDEEIFIVKGELTFDGRQWLGERAYCFHPARTVHGFRSQVDSEAWFISRIKRPLKFDFHEDAESLEPYSLDGVESERGVAVVPTPAERPWEDILDAGGKTIARRQILSVHPGTGEGSMLVEFLPGFVSPHGDHYHSVYEEVFVVSGQLETADGKVFTKGCYSYKPPMYVQSAVSSENGAVAYVNFGGKLDFLPAASKPA